MAEDILRINGMLFHAHHGVEETERLYGQRFEVDVEMALDLSAACRTDRLSDSVDFREVYDVVEEVMLENSFHLVEAIAEAIAQALLERFPVEEVLVRVRKPSPPMRGLVQNVEVEIVRPA